MSLQRLFPIQIRGLRDRSASPKIPESVYLKAYAVYSHVYGAQEAMIDFERGCRGGFGVGELLAFLYAASYPKSEWRMRVEEALTGQNMGA